MRFFEFFNEINLIIIIKNLIDNDEILLLVVARMISREVVCCNFGLNFHFDLNFVYIFD